MSVNYSGTQLLHFGKLLSTRMRQVPAWADLMDVTTEVLEHQVETPRRRLSTIRDPSKVRKDKTITDLYYTGGQVLDHNGNSVALAEGTYIPSARVVEVTVEQDTNDRQGKDAMVVEFALANGKLVQWSLPFTVPQERNLLIESANMLGLDFFNTNLSDKDYLRINEYIAKYWPYGGTNQFVDFMAFVKNIRLECVALWAKVAEQTIDFEDLQELHHGMVPAHKGGEWFLTSHAELRYNPVRDFDLAGNSDSLNTENYLGLEQLFYLFAPINLVLARIVAAIDLNLDFFVACAGDELSVYMAKKNWAYSDFVLDPFLNVSGAGVETYQVKWAYEWPIMRPVITGGAVISSAEIHQQREAYDYSTVSFSFGVQWMSYIDTIEQGNIRWKFPILRSLGEGAAVVQQTEVVGGTFAYDPSTITINIVPFMNGMITHILPTVPAKFEKVFEMVGTLSPFSLVTEVLQGRGFGSYIFVFESDAYDAAFPMHNLNAFYTRGVMAVSTIIYFVTPKETTFTNSGRHLPAGAYTEWVYLMARQAAA